MQTEYEATFTDIDVTDIKNRLRALNAVCLKPEFLQRRITFDLPIPHISTWIRVRDEGKKITLTLKRVDGNIIEGQKEILIEVSDFNKAGELLEAIGCVRKSFQESKRELWLFSGVEITIDTWPFLDPYIEIEGQSEDAVRATASALGLEYATARFCTVDMLYKKKYGKTIDELGKAKKNFVFAMPNPFM